MLEANLISFSSKGFDKMKLLSDDFMCYRSTLAIKNKILKVIIQIWLSLVLVLL